MLRANRIAHAEDVSAAEAVAIHDAVMSVDGGKYGEDASISMAKETPTSFAVWALRGSGLSGYRLTLVSGGDELTITDAEYVPCFYVE